MKLRLLVLSCVLFSFTSCFDIVETFNLREDTGGTYDVKIDMSNMLSMMAMMGSGKDSEKIPEKMDSSFSFAGMVDTVSTLTAEEKNAVSKVTGNIHLDKDKGEMYMVMNMPFKDSKEYDLVQAAFQKMDTGGKSPMDAMFKGIGGGLGGDSPMGDEKDNSGKKGGGGLPGSNFITKITAGSIARTIKPVTQTTDAAKPATDDMPEDFKEMLKVNYTTIINLPRPAKNLTGAGTLSEDKKQVKSTKKVDLSSGFTAGDFDFSIDF